MHAFLVPHSELIKVRRRYHFNNFFSPMQDLVFRPPTVKPGNRAAGVHKPHYLGVRTCSGVEDRLLARRLNGRLGGEQDSTWGWPPWLEQESDRLIGAAPRHGWTFPGMLLVKRG